MPVLARNKKAYFDYEVLGKYEAGLKLLGHEVKAIKDFRISLKGSFVTLKQAEGKRLPELYLINAHVPLYKHAGNIKDYDPYRSRKLLLKKREIAYLVGKKQEQGLTLIPLKMYTKHSLLKLEFALAKGKKKFDKRENIKKRDLERRQREMLKKSVRG
ncbi:SsrA-binding protein SmpB [bacterium]|nr:SsrA-binding protein SmpB [bacterium]